MIIEWNDQLAIDNSIIDEDHKFLIAKITGLLDSIHRGDEKDAILRQLHVIKLFSEEHFKREEELQKAARFPDAERHKAIHVNLLDVLIFNIKRMMVDYSVNDGGESVARRLQAIEKFLYKWLINHIQVEDAKMKPFVAEMRERAAKMSPLRGFIHKLVG